MSLLKCGPFCNRCHPGPFLRGLSDSGLPVVLRPSLRMPAPALLDEATSRLAASGSLETLQRKLSDRLTECGWRDELREAVSDSPNQCATAHRDRRAAASSGSAATRT